MTALDIVNRVLRRLRETEVTAFTDTYPKLILDFVNESKREVEDSWDWTNLRTTINVITDTATKAYSLVGAGQRFRFLHRDGTNNVSAYNVTNRGYLQMVTGDYVQRMVQIGQTTPSIPSMFAVTGQDVNLDPVITLIAVPNTVSTLAFNLVVPQVELVNTTDALTVPWYPVVMGAWARAISERGEDGGQNTSEQASMYQMALSDAISQDAAKTSYETVWNQA